MAKYFVVVILMLVLIGVLLKKEGVPVPDSTETPEIVKQESAIEKTPQQGKLNKQSLDQKAPEEQAQFEAMYEQVRSEYEPFQFSDDWYIEMYTSEANQARCVWRYISNRSYEHMSDKQRLMAESIEAQCNEQKKPKRSSHRELKNLMRAETEAGEALNQAFMALQKDSDLLPLLTWANQRKNHWVLAGVIYHMDSNILTLNAANVLGSEHQHYNQMTFKMATNLLACQMSDASCQPDGAFMFEQCMLDEVYCGMTFNEWYLNHVPIGQQKDVAVLVEWITGSNG